MMLNCAPRPQQTCLGLGTATHLFGSPNPQKGKSLQRKLRDQKGRSKNHPRALIKPCLKLKPISSLVAHGVKDPAMSLLQFRSLLGHEFSS